MRGNKESILLFILTILGLFLFYGTPIFKVKEQDKCKQSWQNILNMTKQDNV
ncbi:hypothetical protein J699_03126 [Acinetobacter sp. 1000160]|nr:hypothetical protein J699_03126 [Acinetobacter sp. 1000160]